VGTQNYPYIENSYMNKLSILALGLLLSVSAFATTAQQATIHITGTIAEVCQLEIDKGTGQFFDATKELVAFDLSKAETNMDAGALKIKCNSPQGFNVRITSAAATSTAATGFGPALVAHTADDVTSPEIATLPNFFPYTVKVDGQSLDLGTPYNLYGAALRTLAEDSLDANSDPAHPILLSHDMPALGSLVAATYVDEVTFTIVHQ
jgi:hypothetical protein